MKTALVTGSTGFLGSHLVMQLLGRGYRVLAMKRQSSNLTLFDSVKQQYLQPVPEPTKEKLQLKALSLDIPQITEGLQHRLHWVLGDVTDTDTLLEAFVFEEKPVDVVFHCAALVSFDPKRVADLFEHNVKGTANVVNTCLKLGVKTLMHTSSVAALGRAKETDVFSEDSEWTDSPYNTDYAVSKYHAELEVWRAKEEGLQVGIINPGIILGFGDGPTASSQLYGIVKSKNPLFPMGSNGFIWVDTLANMFIDVYEQQRFGERFVAVTHNLSYETLFNHIANELGVKAPSIQLKGWKFTLAKWITAILPIAGVSKALVVSTSKQCIYQSRWKF